MKIHKIAAFAAAMAVAGAASAGDNKSTAEKIQMLDTDADGRVSASEYTAKDGKTEADFVKVDANADGYATAAEMEAHWAMSKDKGSMDMGSMDRAQGTQDTMSTPTTATPPRDDDN